MLRRPEGHPLHRYSAVSARLECVSQPLRNAGCPEIISEVGRSNDTRRDGSGTTVESVDIRRQERRRKEKNISGIQGLVVKTLERMILS